MNYALCSIRCDRSVAESCTNWASSTAHRAESSAMVFTATIGWRRESVATTATTASSGARSWIASTF